MHSGELDYKVHIVGLNLSLVRSLVTDGGAAFIALMYDDISLLRVGLSAYRAKNSAAIVCSVAGIYIDVKRA